MPETAFAPQLLPELAEASASGEARRIYGEIRRLAGVPMVALIWRHLATIPGALDWAWALLEPTMRCGVLQRRAWELAAGAVPADTPRIPRAALRAAGLDARDERGIASVLDAYNRANPVNILSVRCIALQLAGDVQPALEAAPLPAWDPPGEVQPLPPMIDPQAMSPTVRELALVLGNRGEDAAPSPLWPSLYRHLAHWPAMLGYASVLIVPRFAAIDRAALQLRERTDEAGAELAREMKLPPGVAAPQADVRVSVQAAIDQFSQRIPEMVVIGGMLRRALPLVER